MLAFLHGKGVTKLWLKDPREWSTAQALACLAVAGLVVGGLAAMLVILPRVRGAARGIVFWKSITLFESGKDYAEHILTREATELTRAKLEPWYELDGICRRKYRVLGVALWWGV